MLWSLMLIMGCIFIDVNYAVGANSLRKSPPEKPSSFNSPQSDLGFSLPSAGNGKLILSKKGHHRPVLSLVKAAKGNLYFLMKI